MASFAPPSTIPHLAFSFHTLPDHPHLTSYCQHHYTLLYILWLSLVMVYLMPELDLHKSYEGDVARPRGTAWEAEGAFTPSWDKLLFCLKTQGPFGTPISPSSFVDFVDFVVKVKICQPLGVYATRESTYWYFNVQDLAHCRFLKTNFPLNKLHRNIIFLSSEFIWHPKQYLFCLFVSLDPLRSLSDSVPQIFQEACLIRMAQGEQVSNRVDVGDKIPLAFCQRGQWCCSRPAATLLLWVS